MFSLLVSASLKAFAFVEISDERFLQKQPAKTEFLLEQSHQ